VRIRVENAGDTTAAQLAIEGALKPPSGEEEKSEITIDYVPGRSERSGALFFKSNPVNSDLQIRPLGYEKP
jgi:uncharacterized protein (TIGR02588 family)